MCGIAGMIDYGHGNLDKATQRTMLRTMRRRGPDAVGTYLGEHVTMLHTRLAVVDIEHGQQPMICRYFGNDYIIVYNGELYNTEDIRADLLREEETFIGHSDTEVLLKAYAHWGEACLDKFNGIFAFGIWDSKKQSLFFARDRMGVKPFFYAHPNGGFIFTSEIKTILEHPDIQPVIDEGGIAEVLFIGPGRTPGCGIFRDIFELKPGHCGYFSREGLRVHPYWSVVDKPYEEDFKIATEQVRTLVVDAIQRQLVSDVPIGSFLSGGLDSSIISAVANRILRARGERLMTFSVRYRDNEKFFTTNRFQPNSDESYINIMVEFLDSIHHDIVLDTPELVHTLNAAVDARDLPGMADVDSSLLLFCERIKQHVTVALSGECADEIFGGYPWYRNEKTRMAYGFPWAQSTAYRENFVHPALRKRLNGFEVVNSRYNASLAEVSKLENLSQLESRMREMVHLNMWWFMQTLLERKDRMSMYSGLEVRVPYCDHRIAQYLYSVPWNMKDYHGMEKGLLRHAAEGLLPESIQWRKKSPYPKTHHPGYLAAVSAVLADVLADDEAPLWQIADRGAVRSLLNADREEPWYGQLMTTPQTIAYFIQLNYWLERYNIRINI